MKNILIDIIFGTLILAAGIAIGIEYANRSTVSGSELQQAYNRGYTDYQIDTYIPAPFLQDEVPAKERNPKLKEKFKG